MNGTPASPATARASSVLPVPGAPTSMTPLGGRAPSRAYLAGFFRISTISWSSSFASSTPATSANVVVGGAIASRARPPRCTPGMDIPPGDPIPRIPGPPKLP